MRKLILLLIAVFFIFIKINNVHSQGLTCATAQQFITGSTVNYPASTNSTAEVGPDYDCLLTQFNPCWYYLQISRSGSITLNISSTACVDIDYCCWGPFISFANICNNLVSGTIVDCSYSTSFGGTCVIPNAQVGEYYMVCITNFSGVPTYITINQTQGNGSAGYPGCDNADFENGNFSDWVGYSGSYTSGVINITHTGIITGDHTIVTGTALDTLSGFNIPIVAPNGGAYSCRLGNDHFKNYVDRLTYTIEVNATNDFFFYNYAAFLQDPTMPPFSFTNFIVDVIDSVNQQVDSAQNYLHISGSSPSWQYQGINLSSHIGETVTIRFTVTNGNNPLSYGYVYIDAGCNSVTTGLKNNFVSDNLPVVYPNPSSDLINIDYTLNNNSDVKIEIIDILGRNVRSIINSRQKTGKYTIKVDLKNDKILPGIYYIRFNVEDKIISSKIIFN